MRRRSVLRRLTKPKRTTPIQTLAKQVMQIKRSLKGERKLINYFQRSSENVGDALVNEVTLINLSQINTWGNIFGSSADDEEGNLAIWKSFGLDFLIKSYNEPTEVNFTVMLVKCKDTMAPYINFATGAVTLTYNVHYISSATTSQTAAGLSMVNKKFFDIIQVRRFTLGNNGTTLGQPSAQTQYGTDRRFYMKVSPNTKLLNSSGNWKSMTTAPDASQTYLLLVFNNNSSADAENPRIFWNAVHTVQV